MHSEHSGAAIRAEMLMRDNPATGARDDGHPRMVGQAGPGRSGACQGRERQVQGSLGCAQI
ncbi:hypothetical protein RI444_22605 (plasmid) [Paenarthrobacter sp. AT5]|uniref:hypothetical protein n=1 Tax=Paenarthrobacter sp. AT5 TaxID=2973089 RepID=UPI0029344113|nr:hypothetical protein [Paenarthrobacter sp. AT5]WOC63449.1 hypothetical protein RI444_22605 [Paenarthrobacter sp. AT5]